MNTPASLKRRLCLSSSKSEPPSKQPKCFQDVVALSRLNFSTSKKEPLNFTQYASLNDNCAGNNNIYSAFSSDQRRAFGKLHQVISDSRSSVTLLDCPPGTGKTFTIACFSLSYVKNVQVIVYKCELAEEMGKVQTLSACTVKKFTMNTFGVSYTQRFNCYGTNETDMDILVRLIILVKDATFLSFNHYDVLVVDEFTVLTPEIIIILYLFGQYFGVHLVFCGDSQQQNSIEPSAHHSRDGKSISNSYLLKHLANSKISMNILMRCSDEWYNDILREFREILKRTGFGDTKFYYNVEYFLFIQLNACYFRKVDYDARLLAAWHTTLTKRMQKVIQRLGEKNIPHTIARYFGKVRIGDGLKLIPLPVESTKFFVGLLLQVGQSYLYTGGPTLTTLKNTPTVSYGKVKLKNIQVDKFGDPFVLTVEFEDGKEYSIGRVTLKPTQILQSLSDHIKQQPCYVDNKASGIVQFPIIGTQTSTFHNAQGLTIDGKVELDTTNASCESVYVGLSRITRGENLHRIYSPRMHSLRVSHLFEKSGDTTYYYHGTEDKLGQLFAKIKDISEDEQLKILLKLQFEETTSIVEFEKKKINKMVKIRRELYSNVSSVGKPETRLGQICKYLSSINVKELMDSISATTSDIPIKCLFSPGNVSIVRNLIPNFDLLEKNYATFEESPDLTSSEPKDKIRV